MSKSSQSASADSADEEDSSFLTSNTSWAEIIAPTITSACLGLVCLVIYYLNRGDLMLYRIRPFLRPNRRWPAWPRGWKEWLSPLWDPKEEEILTTGGPDLYVMVSLLRHGLQYCSVVGTLAVLVLIPAYFRGKDGANNSGFAACTLAHVEPGSKLLWLPAIYTWLGSLFLMSKFREGWRKFLTIRLTYFARGYDPHEDPQTRYTAMVESIPPQLCTKQALFEFFEELFPHSVSSVHIMYDLRCLDKIVAQRHHSLIEWEDAILYREVTGKSKRMMVRHYDGVLTTLNILPKYTKEGEEVDAEEYLEAKAQHLSRLINCWLDAWTLVAPRPAPNACEGDENLPLIGQGVRLVASSFKHLPAVLRRRRRPSRRLSGASVRDSIGSGGGGVDKGDTRLGASSSDGGGGVDMGDTCLGAGSSGGGGRSGSAISLLHLQTEGTQEEERAGEGTTEMEDGMRYDDDVESAGGGVLVTAEGEVLTLTSTLAASEEKCETPTMTTMTTVTDVEGNIEVSSENEGGRFLSSCSNCTLLYEADGGADMGEGGRRNPLITDLRTECMSQIVACSTGFVTFKTLLAKAASMSGPLTREPVLHVSHAPQPSEIYWPNLITPASKVVILNHIASYLIATLALFFFIPVGVIQYIANLSSGWLSQYIPVLLALLLVRAVPVVLEQVAMRFVKIRSKEHMEEWQLQRHFLVLTGYIFASIIFSVIFQSLNDVLRNVDLSYIAHNIDTLIKRIGESVPLVGIFFFNYIMSEALISGGLEFGRVVDIFRVGLKVWFRDRRLITPREYREEVYQMRLHRPKFGSRMPRHLIILTICFIYGPIAPLTMIAGLVFFATTLIVFHYKSMFMFVSPFETGGTYVFWVYRCTMMAYLSSIITLIIYLLIKQGWGPVFLLIPLIPIMVDEWHTLERQYLVRCESVPLREAMLLDEGRYDSDDDDSEDEEERRTETAVNVGNEGEKDHYRRRRRFTSSRFDDLLFSHPSLKTPREVQPARQLRWVPPSAHLPFSFNPETRYGVGPARDRKEPKQGKRREGAKKASNKHVQPNDDNGGDIMEQSSGYQGHSVRAPTLQETIQQDQGEIQYVRGSLRINKGNALQRRVAFRELGKQRPQLRQTISASGESGGGVADTGAGSRAEVRSLSAPITTNTAAAAADDDVGVCVGVMAVVMEKEEAPLAIN